MSRTVRFLHTADIHLGSSLQSFSQAPAKVREELRTATYTAFCRICDAAIRYDVDFVLIAGDLFEQEARSVRANHFFIQQARRLEEAGIPIYLVYGNHDPLPGTGELLDLPSNVQVFAPDSLTPAEVRDNSGRLLARIFGASYRSRFESRPLYDLYTPPDTAVVNIGLLHTALDPHNPHYSPCSVADLTGKKGIHYWALGHNHRPAVVRHESPVIAYPGIPQGRDPGEPGVGGCFLVEASPDFNPQLRFIPTASLVWQEVTVSIETPAGGTGKEHIRNLSDIERLMIARAKEVLAQKPPLSSDLPLVEREHSWGESITGYIIRWVLTGRGEVHEMLNEGEGEVAAALAACLRRELCQNRPFLWTESVVIRTGRPLPDWGRMRYSSELFSTIDDVVQACCSDSDLRQEVLQAMGSIWDSNQDPENAKMERFLVTDEILTTIMKQARQLVLEKIQERRQQA